MVSRSMCRSASRSASGCTDFFSFVSLHYPATSLALQGFHRLSPRSAVWCGRGEFWRSVHQENLPLKLRVRLVPLIFACFFAFQPLCKTMSHSPTASIVRFFLRTASLDPNYRCDLIGQPLPFL